jgi:hypothetical protein
MMTVNFTGMGGMQEYTCDAEEETMTTEKEAVALACKFGILPYRDFNMVNELYHYAASKEQLAALIAHIRAEQSAKIAMLREALKFYADGNHFIMDDPDSLATVEDGTTAQQALSATSADAEAYEQSIREDERRKMLERKQYLVYQDGSQWCAVGKWFTNLQDCDAGFGDTPLAALGELIVQEGEPK